MQRELSIASSSRFVVSPIPTSEGRDEGMAVRDENGNQRFLLKLMDRERPGGQNKGGSAADSNVFTSYDDAPSAVSSPDLTPISDPRRIFPQTYDFKLTDNDGKTSYLVHAKTTGTSARPNSFEILNGSDEKVAAIQNQPDRGWYLTEKDGSRVAFSNLRIKEDVGTTRRRNQDDNRRAPERVDVRDEWGHSPRQEDVADRFTIVVPGTEQPLAQIYPGTPREGLNVGQVTSDAFEIKFDPEASLPEAKSDSAETLDPGLVLCFAEALRLVSRA